MDEIWFWMDRFIAVVFVVAIFLSVVNWLLGKIKKLKEKE